MTEAEAIQLHRDRLASARRQHTREMSTFTEGTRNREFYESWARLKMKASLSQGLLNEDLRKIPKPRRLHAPSRADNV